MSSVLLDTVIIGAGPAGASAAIYASRAGLSSLWLDDRFIPGGQIADSSFVDNYPGLPGISGADLGEALAGHASKLSMNPVRAKVLSVLPGKDKAWVVHTKKNDYHTKTVIYASGARHRHLGIPGEEELSGSGVSYCATCDGAFFKDRVVCVIGGGNTACEDAVFLAKLCKRVYLIHRRNELRADEMLKERVKSMDRVEILWNTVPVGIEGETCVTGLRIRRVNEGESKTGPVREECQLLPVDGVFIAAGMVPNSSLLKDLADIDESEYVIAGEDCITSAAGIFAAGDVRTKPLRQIVTAVADGANAVVSAQRYLHDMVNNDKYKLK